MPLFSMPVRHARPSLAAAGLATVAFALLPLGAATAADPVEAEGEGLQAAAGDAMVIGAHTNPGNLSGTVDPPILEREVSLISASQNYISSWTGPGEFDAAETAAHDGIVDWADERGMLVHDWLPFGPEHYLTDTLRADLEAMDAESLKAEIRNAVAAFGASGGNADQVDYWTVVNEAIRVEDGGYVPTVWNNAGMEPDRSGLTGEEAPLSEHPVYIREAFEAAESMPGKLGLRDNNMEFPAGPKADSFYQLVKHLLASGVELEVVEFQMHMNAYPAGSVPENYQAAQSNADGSYDWAGFQANVKRFTDLGLEVHLGEVDFYTSGYEVGSAEAEEAQRGAAYGLVTAARGAGVDVITNWGFREGSMGGQGDDAQAQILNADGSPKPAYDGFLQALLDTADAAAPVPDGRAGIIVV